MKRGVLFYPLRRANYLGGKRNVYVCEEKEGKFGVKDTRDSSINYYTADELNKFRETNTVFGSKGEEGYFIVDVTEYQTLDTDDYLIFSFVDASANKVYIGIEEKKNNAVIYSRIFNSYFSDFPECKSDTEPKNGELMWIFEEGKNNKCFGFSLWLEYTISNEGSNPVCLEFFVEISPDCKLTEVSASDDWEFNESSPEPVYDEKTDSITFRSIRSMSGF